MMLAWGPHVFTSRGMAYEELRHRAGGRWRDHEIIGRRPVGQYLGPDKETLKLKGCSFPADDGPAAMASLRALQDAAREGAVHILATGRGEVLGTFRVEHAERSEAFPIRNGAPLKLEFDVEFAV